MSFKRLLSLFVLLLCAPAMAEEAKPVSAASDVRLDHTDWSSNFSNSGTLDQDDGEGDNVRRLHIEKSGIDDDSSDDYQSSEE